MIMRKNDTPRNRAKAPLLMPQAARLLGGGLCLIYPSLLRLLFEVQRAATITQAKASYFGSLLEYPAAALVLLTAATLLLDRMARTEQAT